MSATGFRNPSLLSIARADWGFGADCQSNASAKGGIAGAGWGMAHDG